MSTSSAEEDRLAALGALAEPLRRRLYRYVVGRSEPVSRDDAAAAMETPRSVAAFHLDKLAEAGLLEVEFRRPPGRGGPGAGRPAKLYRAAVSETSLSVPERRYEVAATLLAQAVADASAQGVAAADQLGATARSYGRQLGAAAVTDARTPDERRERLVALLEAHGYAPSIEDDVVVLGNCPYRRLADAHPELVCAMNREIAAGILEAAGLSPAGARLDPAPGRCCVTLLAG
jgi:predicted ArsR family transcriptional regulator